MNLINRTIHRFDIIQIVEIIIFSLLAICLFFYALCSKNINNENVIYVIIVLIVIALIYPIIVITKVIFLVIKKLYTLKRIFIFGFIVILYFAFIISILFLIMVRKNTPYNQPNDVNSLKVRTYISAKGFKNSEIKKIHIYEYGKDTEFSLLLREIPVTEFWNYGIEGKDSLSIMTDWMIVINDTISYRITEQKAEIQLAGKYWENRIVSYVINGKKYDEGGIDIEKDIGKIEK